MDTLHNMFTRLLGEAFQAERIIVQLISKRIQELGVALTPEQIESLRQQLQVEQLDSIQIDFTDEQASELQRQGHDPENIVLDLSDFDLSDDRVHNIVSNAMNEALSLVSQTLFEAWKEQAPSLLPQQEEERLQFASHVRENWSRPIELLEILLSVSHEAGAAFNYHFRPAAAKENDFVFEALTRLHARGCQVASEILILLKNGFADGAHARWRTLHEIAVTAMFIAKHGVGVAERYLHHSAVSDYHEADLYQQYHSVLGYAAIEQDVLNGLRAARDQAIRRFGNNFRYDYGWAADVLPMDCPRFVDIERDVQLTHLRPFYKLANMNVHAGSKGISFRLGSPPVGDDLLLSGASIYGLAEPGQNAALSVHQLTVTLLLTKPNIDRLAFSKTSQALVNEVFWTFDELMDSTIEGENEEET